MLRTMLIAFNKIFGSFICLDNNYACLFVCFSIPLKPLVCHKALGMENYAISNGQVKASTEWDGYHAAIQGRLHFKETPGKRGSWSALTNDVNQWLQVNLRSELTRVTGVASQGRNSLVFNQWVTKYKLQYSSDGVSFTYYQEEGQGAEKVKKKR